MDKRAIEILLNVHGSPSRWKDAREGTIDFEYAKSAGVMFDPVRISHAQIVKGAIKARDALTPKAVADGFLASLSTRRLDLRSALGSFAVLQFFPEHGFSPKERCCVICGSYEQGTEPEDLNVLNFERFKWGGVRHDQPLFATFDLEQFLKEDSSRPSPTDIRIFRDLLQTVEAVPPDTSAALLSKHLTAPGFKSNKAERDIIIGILGLCGILGTAAHPGFFRRFVPYSQRELPPRHFVDMHYPACWWRRSDGINRDALAVYFGHVL